MTIHQVGGLSGRGGALIAVFLMGALLAQLTQAAVLRVNTASAVASPDGLSWDAAFPKLQPAVDSAVSGDEVWVAAGVYTGTGDCVVNLKDGVTLYGGFVGLESARDQRNWKTSNTIIDGQGTRRCVTANDTGTVDGMVLQRGLANYGGGMISGTAVNCVFADNVADGQFVGSGGGMNGGAAINCTFIRNSAGDGGGANAITAVNCIFFGNTGSALMSSDAISCTIAGNTGYGISSGTATNCIIWGNNPDEVICAQVSYSCLPVPTEGTGNLVANPQFVNFRAGDLHLHAASPCIDAGTASGAPATDIALRPRPHGSAQDMGAYEFYVGDDVNAADSTVLRVNAASTAVNPDGVTWETAFPTLQAAADHSGYGGEIWVAKGTYTSEASAAVKLPPATLVYGGFSGTETAREQRDWTANQTIIDGQNVRQCVSGNASSTVDGFTIQNGKADYGAGAMCGWTANCVFSGSQAQFCGGGFYGAVAAGCTFSKNTAGTGGGGMCGTEADDCTFTENSSMGFHGGVGGGMYGGRANRCVFNKNVSYSGGGTAGCIATNCTFLDNESRTSAVMGSVIGGLGGGMYGREAIGCTFIGNNATPLTLDPDSFGGNGGAVASVTAINCLFSRNTALRGGAAYEGRAVNCTFFGNTAKAADDGGMHSGTAANCIFWGNSPEETAATTVSYSCLGAAAAGEGNFIADPLFVNAAEGNFRLQSGSSCINTGTSNGAPATDILGTTRPQGPACDVGAYEFPYMAAPDLSGLARAAAEQALTAVQLHVGEETEEYSLTVPVGQVIRQNPAAGTQVSQGSPVSLVTSKGPQPVQMPQLIGQTQEFALQTIADAGLAVGTVTQQYSLTVPAGSVLLQTPEADAETFQGVSVDLVISQGGIAVPDVAGQTWDTASVAITNALLTVGTVTEQYSPTIPSGVVISQTPIAGTSVLPGGSVDLVVSRKVQPAVVPDVVGQTQTQAESAITGSGLTVGSTTGAYSSTVPVGSVVSQSPPAGVGLPPGTGISIVVSLGAEPGVEGESPVDTDTARQQLAEVFEQADANGDGNLSFVEAVGVVPGLTQAVFSALDADGNGQLSSDELGLDAGFGCAGCKGATKKSLNGEFAVLSGLLGLVVMVGVKG